MMRYCVRLSSLSSVQQILKPNFGFKSSNNAKIINNCIAKQLSSVAPNNSVKITERPYYPHHTVAVINIMQQFDFAEDEVKMLLVNQPELMNIPSGLWTEVLQSFSDFGFEKENIVKVLESNPKLLFMKKNILNKNLEAWLDCGFGQDLLLQVLTANPTFIQVDHIHVLKRVKQYQLHFESKKRVGKLLLLAPNTLEESWDVLLEKLNYLDNLCTENSDVAASGVLAHSMFHIKVRHEFLIRAGLYKKPQKDFRKKLSKNPKLTTIVNTNDQQFVSNCGLSLLEYDVFVDMFKEEVAEDNYDSDSDSDVEVGNQNT